MQPDQRAVKAGRNEIEPQKPQTIARSLAIGNPADGFYAAKTILGSGGWAEDASDPEIVEAMTLLAESEGVFTETAGGVTVAAARNSMRKGVSVRMRLPCSASPATDLKPRMLLQASSIG